MAILAINPTRMELLILKKKLAGAQRGHKLLKDKQDGLMKKFMEIIHSAKDEREKVEKILANAFGKMLIASAMTNPVELVSALNYTKCVSSLDVETKNVMSVRIPEFTYNLEGEINSYGYTQTTGDLDEALKAFYEALPFLVKLSEIEKTAEALAAELETTRRRVNALEYKIVPDMQETIKFIQLKLDEMERATILVSMRMKKLKEAEAVAAV